MIPIQMDNDQVPAIRFGQSDPKETQTRKTTNWNWELTHPQKKQDTSIVRKIQQTMNSPKLNLFHLPSRFVEKIQKIQPLRSIQC